jgi:hypothetical protein
MTLHRPSLAAFTADALTFLGTLTIAAVIADYRAEALDTRRHAIDVEAENEALRYEVWRLNRIAGQLADANAEHALVVSAAEEIIRRVEAEEAQRMREEGTA